MTHVDDDKDEAGEATEVVLPLLGVLLEGAVEQKLQGLSQSVEVDKSEDLEAVVFSAFIHEELWYSGDNIKDKVSGQVILANVDEILVGSSLLDEIEQDLDKLNYVDSNFKLVKLVLPRVLGIDLEATWVKASGSLFFSSTERSYVFRSTLTFVEMGENI